MKKEIKLADKNRCTGCAACKAACPKKCISFKADAEGFLYPEIDRDTCARCGACMSACPLEKLYIKEEEELPDAFLIRRKKKEDRLAAASGGAFTAIAEQVVKEHGLVFGAAFDLDFKVKHTYAWDRDGVRAFSRSKYVQSDMGNSFLLIKRTLEKGRKVLFSGTACQIYGLKSFLKKDYPNLYCVDIVCHGVPSPLVFEKYLAWQKERMRSEIESVAIRDKKSFKKFYRAGYGITFENGEKYFKVTDEDPMGRMFLSGICDRPSCYECPYKTVWRESDLTLGDCWFSKELAGVPDTDGFTLVLVQSGKGRDLLGDCTKDIDVFKVNSEAAIKANGGKIYSSVHPHKRREEFMAEMPDADFECLADKYFSENKSIKKEAVGLLKEKGLIPQPLIDRKNKKELARRLQREIPDEAKGRTKIG